VLNVDKKIKIDEIYVPMSKQKTLNAAKVEEIATSMLESGQKTPILVRADGARYVLVEGLHRLEAAKAIGETTIVCMVVQARRS
jgi:ParB-like chromosome segregation protein Spo0J